LPPAIAPGAFVILSGRVDVTRRRPHGQSELIVTNGPGSFMGELAQLSDRPSLVDADATIEVERPSGVKLRLTGSVDEAALTPGLVGAVVIGIPGKQRHLPRRSPTARPFRPRGCAASRAAREKPRCVSPKLDSRHPEPYQRSVAERFSPPLK